MGGFSDILDDIDCMALYWERRKEDILLPAADEFVAYVKPLYLSLGARPTRAELDCLNVAFTEWLLFERRQREGRTPFEDFVERRPVAMPKRSWARLQQVAKTQFFSRFAIWDKDRATGMCTLCDVCTDARYEVFDERLADSARWKEGTIGERIARVDGAWLAVAPSRLYDRAAPACTAEDGPGSIHPEEAEGMPQALRESFFLRLLHDTFGMDGRYHETVRVREVSAA